MCANTVNVHWHKATGSLATTYETAGNSRTVRALTSHLTISAFVLFQAIEASALQRRLSLNGFSTVW